jgi:hypothetical protein
MIRKTQLGFPNSCFDNLKSKIQNRKWPGLSSIAFVLIVCGAVAQAQQPTKIPKIGYLTAPPLSANAARIEAFRQGLRELSYVEEKKISSLTGYLLTENSIASRRSPPS